MTVVRSGSGEWRVLVKHLVFFKPHLVHTLIKSMMRKWVTFIFPTGVLCLGDWNKTSKSCSPWWGDTSLTYVSKIKCSPAIQLQSHSCLATTLHHTLPPRTDSEMWIQNFRRNHLWQISHRRKEYLLFNSAGNYTAKKEEKKAYYRGLRWP